MKKNIAAAAVAAIAALTGCSVAAPAPAESTGAPAPSAVAESSSPVTSGASAHATGTREACELFNQLVAEYAAVPATDAKGYEDVYLKAQDAKDTVAGDLQGLFASLSLLAIDHSSAAESGGKPAQESQDAVRDAVFANSAACTSAGVTLRL